MASSDEDDYWTGAALTENAGDSTDPQPALTIKTIEDIEPLDAQLGVTEPLNVPAALRDALFGQPKVIEGHSIPPLHTYAILDAAKVMGFVEMLDASGLECACLFKGETAEELRDVAPYLVKLEESNAFTRALFTRGDAEWQMWDKEPGIFVRSNASLDAVWRHFRKFSKVRDADDRWMYFRFYSPGVLYSYLDHIQTSTSKIMQWFRVDPTTMIDRIIGFDTFDDLAWSIAHPVDPHNTIAFAGTPVLTPDDMANFAGYRGDSFDRMTALSLVSTYPKLSLDKKEMRDICRTIRNWVAAFDVVGARDVRRLVNLSVYLGMRYDTDPFFGPECERVLRDQGLKAGQKVDRIVAMAKQWLSAPAQKDARYGTR